MRARPTSFTIASAFIGNVAPKPGGVLASGVPAFRPGRIGRIGRVAGGFRFAPAERTEG
jgi:hypothetical protein